MYQNNSKGGICNFNNLLNRVICYRSKRARKDHVNDYIVCVDIILKGIIPYTFRNYIHPNNIIIYMVALELPISITGSGLGTLDFSKVSVNYPNQF